ncbi:hypothetical protein PABG_12287 [Paracoccidioides brasiliensis Pb03]|nr:hypothetical protein PABG_12287 [Paracoccidioides brasiliensis Pb03]
MSFLYCSIMSFTGQRRWERWLGLELRLGMAVRMRLRREMRMTMVCLSLCWEIGAAAHRGVEMVGRCQE